MNFSIVITLKNCMPVAIINEALLKIKTKKSLLDFQIYSIASNDSEKLKMF